MRAPSYGLRPRHTHGKGKTVSFITQIKITRFEQCVAIMAVKINRIVRDEKNIDLMESFWSDRKLVIAHPRSGSKRLKTVVANRVQPILELTHWGRLTVKHPIIGSDNGLSPVRLQPIIWTHDYILSIGH